MNLKIYIQFSKRYYVLSFLSSIYPKKHKQSIYLLLYVASVENAIRTRNNQGLLQPDQLGHPHKAVVHLKKSHQLLTAISLKQMRKEFIILQDWRVLMNLNMCIICYLFLYSLRKFKFLNPL